MKENYAGTMDLDGDEIYFLTLNRGGFVYDFWPSPFNADDIRYTVTREGETEPINSGNLLK